MTLGERAAQLRKRQGKVDGRIREMEKGATIRAIEKAAELTPPTEGDGLSGTHTRTGELKQHWASDSQRIPEKRGSEYHTTLANNMEYASYVNDGHRMDRHFVPGLYVDPFSGHLEFDEEKKREVGMMVGTKTKYVPGLHMTDEAIDVYEQVLKEEAKGMGGLLQ